MEKLERYAEGIHSIFSNVRGVSTCRQRLSLYEIVFCSFTEVAVPV